MLFRNRKAREEFERTALPHLAELYRTARRLSGDPARAEDLVQETYLKAWRSFHRFETGTNCRAWLFKILMNCAHDYRKRWLAAPTADDSEEILEKQAAPSIPLPDELTNRQIFQALEAIPQQFREVVLLADVEEFSYKEIASLLEIRIGTVMSRLSRGRSLLRQRLAELAGIYGIGNAREEGQAG